MPRVANILGALAYRVRIEGAGIPTEGPCILVSNHHGWYFDPPLLAAVPKRPVRFLAKAPLFEMPGLGWVVRSAGAIPVYRPQDVGANRERNEAMFRAAIHAIESGDLLGVFPEGGSTEGPNLSPLKSGTARIALSAARRIGEFPIIPVAMCIDRPLWLRPLARVHVGEAISWSDLARREPTDSSAVSSLTGRIADALSLGIRTLQKENPSPVITLNAA